MQKKTNKLEALEEYYKYGGMPQTLLYGDENEKSFYLKNLFKETYIKDIITRNKIKNSQALKEILSVISSSVGSLTNPLKLQNSFLSIKKENISYKIISNYLDALCDAFIVDKSLRFDVKGKKYINSLKKYYLLDVGLRNAILNFRQIEKSHLMENVIYNELKVQGFNVDVGSLEINGLIEKGAYQKKQLKINFVVNKGDKKCYIQSALSISDNEKFNQKIRGLSKIKDSFKKILITGDFAKHYVTENGIEIVNIYDFVLHDYKI